MSKNNHDEPRLTVGQQIIRSLDEGLGALKSAADPAKHFRITPFRDILPEPFNPRRVRHTRNLVKATPTVFARLLGVSEKTIRSWEKGLTHPSSVACRFMAEIERDPDYWQDRIQKPSPVKDRRMAASGR